MTFLLRFDLLLLQLELVQGRHVLDRLEHRRRGLLLLSGAEQALGFTVPMFKYIHFIY